MRAYRAVLAPFLLSAVLLGVSGGCTSDTVAARGDASTLGAIADPADPQDTYGVLTGDEDYENLYRTTVLLKSRVGSCSGVLIASNLVLTAAHCFCRVTQGPFDKTACVKEATVISHSYVYRPDLKRWEPLIDASRGKVTVHDQFTSERTSSGFVDPDKRVADLAAVLLEQPLKELVPDIRLRREEASVGDELTAVGFGPTAHRAKDTGVRRYGRNVLSNIHLLADKKGRELRFQYPGAHTDEGDSGGPCFHESEGVRWLVGINGGYSNNGTQSWFTSTSSYWDWIDGQIAKAQKLSAP